MTNALIIVTGMTNNTTPSPFVASCSSKATSNYDACNAFDQGQSSLTTGDWLASTTTGWVQLDLGASNNYPPVIGYSILSPMFGTTVSPNTFTLSGSNDGSTFTTLDSQSSITFTYTWQTKAFTFSNTTQYRYYRLTISANNGSGSYCGVGDLSLIVAQPSGTTTVQSVPIERPVKRSTRTIVRQRPGVFASVTTVKMVPVDRPTKRSVRTIIKQRPGFVASVTTPQPFPIDRATKRSTRTIVKQRPGFVASVTTPQPFPIDRPTKRSTRTIVKQRPGFVASITTVKPVPVTFTKQRLVQKTVVKTNKTVVPIAASGQPIVIINSPRRIM